MGLSILQNSVMFLAIALVFLSFHTVKAATASPSGSTRTDQLALLAFKSVISDPLGALSSWRNVSTDPCSWAGVTCGPESPRRVTALELESLQLEGPLSPSISNLTFLRKLQLSFNRFHGSIPQELGRLSSLEYFNLTKNSLEGEIPFGFSSLTMLKTFTLHRNNLTGVIPPLLDENLIGSGSFGSVYKAKLLLGEIDVAIKVLKLHRRGATRSFITECQVLRNVRHRNLLKITTLCSSLDSNGNEFKALVFAYMPNGSLESWLHPETNDKFLESKRLSLHQRLNIAIDVASAIDYLQNSCVPPIVHCDLKPSNILLDKNMTAIVSDFGLARIMSSAFTVDSSFNSTSLMSVRGSIGYVAPEYGMGSQISWQGDVYSYGVLLLEILTGKRPTDDSFVQGLDLHKYVENAFPEMIATILDPQILQEIEDETNGRKLGAHMQEFMVSLFQIGLTCSSESPRGRMGMAAVAEELNSLREMFF